MTLRDTYPPEHPIYKEIEMWTNEFLENVNDNNKIEEILKRENGFARVKNFTVYIGVITALCNVVVSLKKTLENIGEPIEFRLSFDFNEDATKQVIDWVSKLTLCESPERLEKMFEKYDFTNGKVTRRTMIGIILTFLMFLQDANRKIA